MKKFILPLLLVASVGASSYALAADMTVKGAIKTLDAKTCDVTLADGKVYNFGTKCDFSKLKAGENVTITYVVKGKVNEASKIAAE